MPTTRWLLCVLVGAVALSILLGQRVATAQIAATQSPATPPGIPSSVSVAAKDGRATVSWVAPADDGGDPIFRYTVTASPGGATVDVPGVARTAEVLGLSNGVAYRFTVTARNRAGAGPASAVSNAVTPVPTAGTADTAGTPLIDEDFATSSVPFTPVAGGTWGVASGRYVLSAPADGGEAVANANLAVDDTVVTGDFTLSASAATTPTDSLFNDFSVVFGFQDPADYWFASFSEGNDANTSGIFKVAGGARTELADITSPIVAGTPYAIRIERRGASIWVFRSGERVASVTETALGDGQVGFGSRNDGATFDDLVVMGPAPPPPPPPPAPEPPQGFFAGVWAWLRSLFSGGDADPGTPAAAPSHEHWGVPARPSP